MTPVLIIGIVVLGVVVVVLAAVMMVTVILRGMKESLEAQIGSHYEPEDILMKDLTANSFGLESAGVWQVRGNGGLVLTAECLHFFMYLPKREFRVPLDSITELTLTKSHLGRATIYDLLKVRFSVDDSSDSIAWYLADPNAWKSRIEKLKAGGATQERRGTIDGV